MPTKLRKLVIDRVDLVDSGANPDAHIALFKRKGDVIMDFETLLKSLPADQQKLITDQVAKAEAAAADEAKKKAEADAKAKEDAAAKKAQEEKDEMEKSYKAEITKLKGGPSSEEEVLKGLDPAVRAIVEKSRKEAEDANKLAKKLQDESELKKYTEIAKSFNNLPMKAEEVAPILKNIAANNPDDYTKVEGLLKAANEAVEKGEIFKSKGTTGKDDSGSAYAKLETYAKEMVVKSGAQLTPEQAFLKACEMYPEVYAQYVEEEVQ